MKALAIVCCVFLAIAIFDLPYGFYKFLRLSIFFSCVVIIYNEYSQKNAIWLTLFFFVSILFNPISEISLEKEQWLYIDILISILFFIYAFRTESAEIFTYVFPFSINKHSERSDSKKSTDIEIDDVDRFVTLNDDEYAKREKLRLKKLHSSATDVEKIEKRISRFTLHMGDKRKEIDGKLIGDFYDDLEYDIFEELVADYEQGNIVLYPSPILIYRDLLFDIVATGYRKKIQNFIKFMNIVGILLIIWASILTDNYWLLFFSISYYPTVFIAALSSGILALGRLIFAVVILMGLFGMIIFLWAGKVYFAGIVLAILLFFLGGYVYKKNYRAALVESAKISESAFIFLYVIQFIRVFRVRDKKIIKYSSSVS